MGLFDNPTFKRIKKIEEIIRKGKSRPLKRMNIPEGRLELYETETEYVLVKYEDGEHWVADLKDKYSSGVMAAENLDEVFREIVAGAGYRKYLGEQS
jgi:hypothetical protein